MKKFIFVIPLAIASLLASCTNEVIVDKTFTIVWKNYDGTVLEIDENVPLGTIPSYDKEKPTKPSDTQYSYIFSGWSPEITEVKNDQTYIAEYSKDAVEYKVDFLDNKGALCDSKTITIEDLTITSPTYTPTAHFDGYWKEIESGTIIQSGEEFTFAADQLTNHTFIWTEMIHNYEIKFVDSTGIVKSTTINWSKLTIDSPAHLTTQHYENGHWEDENGIEINAGEEFTFTTSQLDNHTFTWVETAHQYTITFKDGSGATTTRFVTVEDPTITSPIHASTTHYDGYWKENETTIQSGTEFTFTTDQLANHTFTWTETVHNYEIKFVDSTGTIKSININLNSLIINAPKHSTTKYYENGHWEDESGIVIGSDTEFTFTINQLANHTFTWIETAHKYSITFKYIDGAKETKNVSAESLKLIAPKTKAISEVSNRFVWVTSDNIVLESEESMDFKTSQLKDYTFTETEAVRYTITYHLDDGVDPGNPTSYDISDTIILKNPTQNGFVFSDWYLDEAKIELLESGGWKPTAKTGNIDLYADWHSETKLNDYSWKEINEISLSGRPDKYFDIGDQKTVPIDGKNYSVRIIDFNHDDKITRVKAGITFDFAKAPCKTQWMPNFDDHNWDYLTSTIKSNTDALFEKFPSSSDSDNPNLKEVVKYVDKKVAVSRNEGESFACTQFPTKLFPLSAGEYGGGMGLGEGDTYLYYLNHPERLDKGASYWTRTPNTGKLWTTYCVSIAGTKEEIHGVSWSLGLAPGFCV